MLLKSRWLLKKLNIIRSERTEIANRLDRVDLDSDVLYLLNNTFGLVPKYIDLI